MYQAKTDPLNDFLTERGLPASGDDPRAIREEMRNEALTAKGENIRRWREYASTTEPAESLTELRLIREMAGLSIGEVSEITGQHPSLVEAAEAGKATIADDALRAFLGAAVAALRAGTDDA